MNTYTRCNKAVLRRLLEPKLDAPVAVMDEPGESPVTPGEDSHLESVEGQIGAERR